jgi:acyl-coenzyme A thioesterase PaaI-like protein
VARVAATVRSVPDDGAATERRVDMWADSVRPEPDLEAAFADLVEEMRRLQDLVTGARPDAASTRAAAHGVAAVADQLTGWQVGEREQIAGTQSHIPGRVQSLIPALHYLDAACAPGESRATVTFTRFYIGGGGAAHGGTLPLVFDDLLGRMVAASGRPRSRTAYLHVDYRSITPLDRELQLHGWVDRVEGRKAFARGTLHDGVTLVCEAEGLFVSLRPGQP